MNHQKKLWSILIAMALLLTLAISAWAEASPNTWQKAIDEDTGAEYYALDVVYVEKPVLASAQHMIIYAPTAYMTENEDGSIVVNPDGAITSSTGTVYTALNAPVLIHNTSGGYSSSTLTVDKSLIAGYLILRNSCKICYCYCLLVTGNDSQRNSGECSRRE